MLKKLEKNRNRGDPIIIFINPLISILKIQNIKKDFSNYKMISKLL